MKLLSVKRPFQLLLTGSMIGVLLSLTTLSFALAQPTTPPQIFYGTVTIVGAPSGAGATVIARVSDIQLGSAITDDRSLYTFSVSSNASPAASSTIDFYVNGVKAAETATYNPSAITEVNLTTSSAGTAPPAILTNSLPGGTIGTAYSQTLQASGGTSPYTWSVVSGSGNLPAGLSLSSSGVITGTPTTADTYSFRVQLSDSNSQSSAATYSIAVSPLETISLNITSSSLPAGTVGSSYSQSLTSSGGTAPYSWALFSGSLPAGLSLSSSGVISGTPSNASTKTFTVRVNDSSSQYSSTTLSITIIADSAVPSEPTPSTTPASTPASAPASTPASAPASTATTSANAPGQASATQTSASAFAISDLTAGVSSTTAGNQVNISVHVTNNGKAQGSKTLVVKINDEGVAQEEVVLEPGESKVVSFAVTKNTPGIYKVSMESLSTSFEVKAEGSSGNSRAEPLSQETVMAILAAGFAAIVVLLVLIIKKYRG